MSVQSVSPHRIPKNVCKFLPIGGRELHDLLEFSYILSLCLWQVYFKYLNYFKKDGSLISEELGINLVD
jgi:hypothetical protein